MGGRGAGQPGRRAAEAEMREDTRTDRSRPPELWPDPRGGKPAPPEEDKDRRWGWRDWLQLLELIPIPQTKIPRVLKGTKAVSAALIRLWKLRWARAAARGALLSEKLLGKRFPKPRRGKPVDQMHWFPEALRDTIAKRFPAADKKALKQATDVVERDFHKYVHGKGSSPGLYKEAYDGKVKEWLDNPEKSKAGFETFKQYIGKLRKDYMDLYQEYQMDVP